MYVERGDTIRGYYYCTVVFVSIYVLPKREPLISSPWALSYSSSMPSAPEMYIYVHKREIYTYIKAETNQGAAVVFVSMHYPNANA